MTEHQATETDERGRTPDCLPFCLGGWHDSECSASALPVESVPVVRGWRVYDDGSRSPSERWVRHADGDWVSLDSTRRTSGDIFMEVTPPPEGCCDYAPPSGPCPAHSAPPEVRS